MHNIQFPVFLLLLLAAVTASCAANRGNVFPLEKGYSGDGDLFARLKSIQERAPEFVKIHILGFSGTENLPLYALEIGKPGLKREILLIGQHHGDEVLGLEIVLAMAEELARKPGSDNLLANYRVWIIPTVNPEGHRVVSSGLYQYKRKNNRDTNNNGILDLHSDGIDLNRNYPVFWDEDAVLPASHRNYKGTAPASEAEVQAVIKFAQRRNFDLVVLYHSSPSGSLSEKVFLPWYDAGNPRQKERFEALLQFAQRYAVMLRKDYLPGTYEVSAFPGSRMGTARNYFFHIHGADAFLVEVGGVNRDGISVIHPPAGMRDKIVVKHLRALRRALEARLTN